MNLIKRYIKRNPYQSFLIFWNLGIFSTLKGLTINLFSNNNLANTFYAYFNVLPTFITDKLGFETSAITNFFETSPFKWLIVSLILTTIYRFLNRLMKLVVTIFILASGVYLIYMFLLAKGLIS